MDQGVDPLRGRLAEQGDRPRRQRPRVEDARPHRVVDVVVDVGEAVDQADDGALQRVRLDLAGVVQDPVPHLLGQVQPAALVLEHVHDPQRVLVVVERRP